MTAARNAAGSPVSDRLLVLQFLRLLNLTALLVVPALAGVETRRAVGSRAGVPGGGGRHRGAAAPDAVARGCDRVVGSAARRPRGRPRRRGHRRLPQPAAVPRVPRRHGGDARCVVPHRVEARGLVRVAAPAGPRRRRRRGRGGCERARRPHRHRQRGRVPVLRGVRGAVLGGERARAAQQSRSSRAAGGARRRPRTRHPARRRARDARPSRVRASRLHPRGRDGRARAWCGKA